MKTLMKQPAPRQLPPATSRRARSVLQPADLEKVDWDFRFDPPPAETRRIKVQFVEGKPQPFVSRPDPRD